MSDVERFAALADDLRAIADRGGLSSPIAMAMQDEIDGPARKFLRGIYIAEGLPALAGALQAVIDGGMSSRALVEELDRIIAMERKGA